MSTDNLQTVSLANRVLDHWQRHELVYPSDAEGNAFWPPNDYVPGTGEKSVWNVSKGTGTIYATTTQHSRSGPSKFFVIVTFDEGFRMLGKLSGNEYARQLIGSRVNTIFSTPANEDDVVYPLFELLEEN